MSSFQPIQPPAPVSRSHWEYLRHELMRVRWPKPDEDPHYLFGQVQGLSYGLCMAHAIDWEAHNRLFALLCNAREQRQAEQRAKDQQA